MPDEDVNEEQKQKVQDQTENANSVTEVVEKHEVEDPLKKVMDAIAESDRKAEARHKAHEDRLLALEQKGTNDLRTKEPKVGEGSHEGNDQPKEGEHQGTDAAGTSKPKPKRANRLKLWRTF